MVVELVLSLQDSQLRKELLESRGPIAQNLVDLLQDVLDLDRFSVVKPLICKALLRLCRSSGLHPRCFTLIGLKKVGQQVAAGGFGDIWKGLVQRQSVCVKVMRLFRDTDIQSLLKEFGREALIWRQLCHPNLLPFLGIYYLDSRLCLVSPWMENGNVMEFLRNQANINRLSLILDVALGLEYLSHRNVVHGDLKAINILVTPSRRACIADFGLAHIANTMTLRFTHSTGNAPGGTGRYLAPELFTGSPSHLGSDVYAFASTCYEILTGRVPFHELLNEMAVMFAVIQGNCPSRSEACCGTSDLDDVWELFQHCWDSQAEARPSAAQIVERLRNLSIPQGTSSSTMDWDETFTSKFRRSLQDQPLLPSVAQIEHLLFRDHESQPHTFGSLGNV
ncbi:kinase-like domain-containing protein [Mycena galopus ATCC 62051]|nr:kinase-like domain-containing protein [Mycena galopus ATCC 62051]